MKAVISDFDRPQVFAVHNRTCAKETILPIVFIEAIITYTQSLQCIHPRDLEMIHILKVMTSNFDRFRFFVMAEIERARLFEGVRLHNDDFAIGLVFQRIVIHFVPPIR